jgi:uncharacterized membrane protein (DUF106 family)
MDKEGKEGSFTPLLIVMLFSLAIASLWNRFPMIKDNVHKILDPSAGLLLEWNIMYGFLILVLILTVITTLAQKIFTDQETLRELKQQQKELNKQSKELRHDPEKMLEINKQAAPLAMKMMKLSMRPVIFTGIPFILFFRWFMDIFTALGNPKFLGFLSWFWFYLIASLIFGSILRKVLKVA